MRPYSLPREIDSLLLSAPLNVQYLTGFTSVNTQEREVFLLITNSSWYLITYQLYHEEAEAVVAQTKTIIPRYIGGGVRLVDHLKGIICKLGIQTMGVESAALSIAEYDYVTTSLPQVRFIKGDQWVEPQRLYKDDSELTLLQNACRLTDDCFTAVQSKIVVGMTEAQLAWELEKYIKEHSGTLSFAPIVSFNEHSSIPHHMPSDRTPLTANSLILFDFGAMIDGYHADMTRVVFFGTPKPEWTKAYGTVFAAQQTALKYLQSENDPSGAQADRLAQKVITDAGYQPYPHGLGHGVGLEIHESPRLSIHREEILKPGMVFSVEPGIYLPGKFGIRIEDLVVKTKTGIDILSHSPYRL